MCVCVQTLSALVNSYMYQCMHACICACVSPSNCISLTGHISALDVWMCVHCDIPKNNFCDCTVVFLSV